MNGKISLICATINVIFASQAWLSGDYFVFALCIFFAVYCGRNFQQANKKPWDD